jgi:uncharacterized protein with FMN-binding domain
MKEKIIKRIAAMGAVLVLLLTISVFFVNRGMDKIDALVINPVDIVSIPDGTYKGNYCEGRWCYDLSVQVEGGRIVSITLNDDIMKIFQSVHEKLTKEIVDQQRITVDAVSGATITSKAFLKAVENALHAGDTTTNIQ